MGLGRGARPQLPRLLRTRSLSSTWRPQLPARLGSVSRRWDRQPRVPYHAFASVHITRDPPEPGGKIERADAQPQPEAGGAEEMLSAVTAIIPNRRRAAQRQQVRIAHRQADTRMEANAGAF